MKTGHLILGGLGIAGLYAWHRKRSTEGSQPLYSTGSTAQAALADGSAVQVPSSSLGTASIMPLTPGQTFAPAPGSPSFYDERIATYRAQLDATKPGTSRAKQLAQWIKNAEANKRKASR